MMYSEFLEKTGFTERYIPYKMYKDFIEPCYMESTLNQKIFCKRFYKLHTSLVSSSVDLLFKTVDSNVLEEYVFGEKKVPEQILDIQKIQDRLLVGFLIGVKKLEYKELL